MFLTILKYNLKLNIMYRIVIVCIGLLFLTSSTAQVPGMMGYRDYRDIADAYFMDFKGTDKFDIKDVKGSPFLIENFSTGYIIDTKASNKAQTNLRYDVYNDVFEIQLNPGDGSLKTLERTPRFEYMLNNEKFVLVETKAINVEHYTSGNGYVVELTSPEAGATLYKRYYKELKPGAKATTSYQADTPPSISSKILYLIDIDSKFVVAEDHRKKVLDAFPSNKQSELKDFIKNKSLRFKGSDKDIQNDMIQLVRYYNSF